MTLSGVLKDILLVMASLLIFADPVSPLQAFGYSVALAGLVYYKLGADALRGHVANVGRSWADLGARRPALRKLIVAAGVLVTLFCLLVGVSSAGVVPENYDAAKMGMQKLHTAMGQTNA